MYCEKKADAMDNKPKGGIDKTVRTTYAAFNEAGERASGECD